MKLKYVTAVNPDAPTVKEINDATDISAYFDELAASMGLHGDEARNAIKAFTYLGNALSPKEELKWRLTEWANGRDPGKPRTWRGL